MAYRFYLDGVALPLPPERLTMRAGNNNRVAVLLDGRELNMLTSPGLTQIAFEARLPSVRYPFAFYPQGFRQAVYYLEAFERLKRGKRPFDLTILRARPDGVPLFDTVLQVSLEQFEVLEDTGEGMDARVSIQLKQYIHAAPRYLRAQGGAYALENAVRYSNRGDTGAPYALCVGESLWNVAQRHYGDGELFLRLWAHNIGKVENPVRAEAAAVIELPARETLEAAVSVAGMAMPVCGVFPADGQWAAREAEA